MNALALNLRRSLVAVIAFTIFFGFVYAFAGTGVAQLFFRHQADGSITANGSTLIGQNWNEYKTDAIVNPQWFHGRPDANNPLEATGTSGYSAASNLGPRSKVLATDVAKLVKAWRKVGVNPTSDLVTTSASGLDPDISPQDATAEIPMVSKATGISPSRLSQLISKHTNGPELGFLGSSTVNVLQLNEALAKLR